MAQPTSGSGSVSPHPNDPALKDNSPMLIYPTSFADIRTLLSDLPGPDRQASDAAWARERQLTKPPGALGRLENINAWLSGWQGAHPPKLDTSTIIVFAANHGVAARGVSAFPSEVTAQMVANFQAGGAAINQLARVADANLLVIDVGVEAPTADLCEQPAMSEEEFLEAFRAGMEAVPANCDLLALGEMGIANTTAASALALACFGGEAEDWTGAGTGVEGAAMANKLSVVTRAVAHHRTCKDPLELSAALGGKELAAIAGAVIKARLQQTPVLLDGFITTAACAPLTQLHANALDHCLVSHRSREPGHRRLLSTLDVEPLMDLSLALGEGSGAAIAVQLVRSAVACHLGMATFAEAAVSDKD